MKFRRQVPIDDFDDFIVDFYCDELKLVIEIDGDVHDREEHAKRDAARDKRLSHLGYTVLRFFNSLVINNPEGQSDLPGRPGLGFWGLRSASGQVLTPDEPSEEAWIAMVGAVYRQAWPEDLDGLPPA